VEVPKPEAKKLGNHEPIAYSLKNIFLKWESLRLSFAQILICSVCE